MGHEVGSMASRLGFWVRGWCLGSEPEIKAGIRPPEDGTISGTLF